MTIAAVYLGGVLRPAAPLPLADGTAVEVEVRPTPAGPPAEDPVLARLRARNAAGGLPPPVVPDPEEAFRLMDAIRLLPEVPTGDPTVTARGHDQALYGPTGAR